MLGWTSQADAKKISFSTPRKYFYSKQKGNVMCCLAWWLCLPHKHDKITIKFSSKNYQFEIKPTIYFQFLSRDPSNNQPNIKKFLVGIEPTDSLRIKNRQNKYIHCRLNPDNNLYVFSQNIYFSIYSKLASKSHRPCA